MGKLERAPYVPAGIIILLGAVMAAGGAKLALLGGSLYYLIAGLLMVTSGSLLIAKRIAGAWLYGITVLGTLLWSLWETGFDGWSLAGRLGILALIGIYPSFSVCRRIPIPPPSVDDPRPRREARRIRTAWLWAAIVVVVIGAAVAVLMTRAGPSPAAPDSNMSAGGAMSAAGEWQHYGRSQAGDRHSSLTQISPANVGSLKLAWTYQTRIAAFAHHGFEATPLKINNGLYLCGDRNQVIALNPDTGAELWRFDPHTNLQGVFGAYCRGVSYYKSPVATGDCPERIISSASDGRLFALDIHTGQLCTTFGVGGYVNLLEGMGEVLPGYAYPTSPPTMVRGLAVVGQWITDGQSVGEPSGVVRAYDALTGKLAWAWDVGRPTDSQLPPAGESYTRGTPNAWGVFSADEDLGLVYVPTGNSTPDYFGAHRSAESEQYSSSVVALDVSTGQVRWTFQTVHHDIWDYDVGAQPVLYDFPTADGIIPALIQPTKRGQIFVLDRRTGKPVVAVKEQPVPRDAVAGDWAAPTQPYSVGMPSFAGPPLREADMWGVTPLDELWCRIRFRAARYEGEFTPVTTQPTIISPGYVGGINWGSVSLDPDRQLMVVNAMRLANYDVLVTRAEADRRGLKPSGHPGGNSDVATAVPQMGTPYAVQTPPFMSPLDIPCQRPPYGTLSVVDLKTRKAVWSQSLGTARDIGPLGYASMLPVTIGVPLAGGSITTGSGLVFIAATQDHYLRAFDIRNGSEVWRARLPTSAQATPMTYTSSSTGRQFIVVAAGGHPGMPTKAGDYVLAFALPENRDRK